MQARVIQFPGTAPVRDDAAHYRALWKSNEALIRAMKADLRRMERIAAGLGLLALAGWAMWWMGVRA